MTDVRYGVVPDALAELARSGSAVLSRPFNQVNFLVLHVVDYPGHLLEVLKRQVLNETLTSSAYGVGLVIGTQLGKVESQMLTRHRGSSSPLEVLTEDMDNQGSRFHGSARPNPSFIYPPGRSLEGLLTLETNQVRPTLRHALAIKEVMREVAALSASADVDSPLLSLQTPVQLPPHAQGGQVSRSRSEWGWASSIGVRFAIALTENNSRTRTRIADRLALFAATRGYAFDLGDLRMGYRSGNWFPIVPYDAKAARQHVHSLPVPHGVRGLAGCVPITLVGPARSGSTNAILDALDRAPDVGVLACTISALDDLAFVHLLLTGPQTAAIVNGSFNPALQDLQVDSRRDLAETLAKVLSQLSTGRTDSLSPVRLVRPLVDMAADYQPLVGPVVNVDAAFGLERRPIWVSWHADGADADMPTVVEALTDALTQSGLEPVVTRSRSAPNFEYLICRRIGVSFTRGKGKLSVPDDAVRAMRKGSVLGSDLEWDQSRLCVRIEDAWRGILFDRGLSGLVDVGVAWREYWRGHAPQ